MGTRLYMIRHKGTGQFSTGNRRPRFVPKFIAKAWTSPSNLTKHLRMVLSDWPYENCEVVLFNVVEEGVHSITDYAGVAE